MRHPFRRALVTTAALGLTLSLVPATASNAAPVVQPELFGQHVASISSSVAGVPRGGVIGAIRLWDSGVTWRQLEPVQGQINWPLLESAVDNAEKLGAREIMFTLGSTPDWAASPTTAQQKAWALYGANSNSHPRDNAYFTDFLKKVAAKYRGRITSYQMWNEANLREFYVGTPTQMAQLTKAASIALDTADPGAKLVAASTTVRAKGPVGKFGKAYGAAMRKVGWRYVDAVSAHFYPPATSGPATRVAYIKTTKSYYKRWGARSKPLWDTEMNYGDTRSYMKTKRTYTGPTAATYVARTFIDSMRYGVKRVFWYGWDIQVLGTDMTTRVGSGAITAGGQAFLETRDWMANKSWYGCKVKSSVTTCTLRGSDGKSTIRYAAKSKSFTLPAGTKAIRDLKGGTNAASAGQKITLTTQPILVVGG